MSKKNWVIMITVFAITLGVISFGIIKLFGNTEEESKVEREKEISENYDNQEEQDENTEELEMEWEKNKEVSEEEINNTRMLEEKLGLKEGELLSHTEIQNAVVDIKEDGEKVENKLEEDYGILVRTQYEENISIREEFNKYDLNQLAITFPTLNIEEGYIYPLLKPIEKISSPVYGDVIKENALIYGEEQIGKGKNIQIEEKPRYFKDIDGFEEIEDGVEIGYISLEYNDDRDKLERLGIDEKDIDDYIGYTVTYNIKLEEDMTEDDIEEKIDKIKINGEKGTKLFNTIKKEFNFRYVGDSVLEVNVPIGKDKLFKKNKEEKEKKWEKGEITEVKIDINGKRMVLDKITSEEYEKGFYIND